MLASQLLRLGTFTILKSQQYVFDENILEHCFDSSCAGRHARNELRRMKKVVKNIARGSILTIGVALINV